MSEDKKRAEMIDEFLKKYKTSEAKPLNDQTSAVPIKLDDFLKDFSQGPAKPLDIKTQEEKIQDAIVAFIDMRDLAKQFLKLQPLYYDQYKIWWVWNFRDYKWQIMDETDLLNMIAKSSRANTIRSRDRNEIIEALKQVGRENKPEKIKKTWVQFREKIIDIKTGEETKASPKYFVTNPIPWSIGANNTNTPTLDKIFGEWVGEDYVKTLYQIIAYCILPDYPLNRLFCLMGEGLNGKSKYLELITRFLGMANSASTELDLLLTSRFEITRLHKKLVCQMGETNFNELKQTATLKKLTGGDMIGFEYKNKDPFQDYNYAKILISTNNLPTTTDKTLGFYRRWLIIDFPNKFNEKRDILADIPEKEYRALACKCVVTLRELLEVKEFHNEGSPEQRGVRYEEKSNPFDKFWNEMVEEDVVDDHIYKFEFRKSIDEWCSHNKFRKLSDSFIKEKMREKGVNESRITVTEDWYNQENAPPKRYTAWVGIKWKSVSDSVVKVEESNNDDVVKVDSIHVGDVKGVKDVRGVPLTTTHGNLSEIGVTALTGLTLDDKNVAFPKRCQGTNKSDTTKATKTDKTNNYLETHPTGDLQDLEENIGLSMSQKLLKTGVIFESKPGRYITL